MKIMLKETHYKTFEVDDNMTVKDIERKYADGTLLMNYEYGKSSICLDASFQNGTWQKVF